MEFKCEACGYTAQLPIRYMGKAVTCPKCKASVEVAGLIEECPGFHRCSQCNALISLSLEICPSCKNAVITHFQHPEAPEMGESSLVKSELVVGLLRKKSKWGLLLQLAVSLSPWITAATILIGNWSVQGERALGEVIIGGIKVFYVSLAAGGIGLVLLFLRGREYLINTVIALVPGVVILCWFLFS